MTALPARRGALGLPFDLVGPWQTFFGQGIKVEETVEDDAYVLRAELPGVDVENNVNVHVADGVLKIRAERKTDRKESEHSEFHYGMFSRAVQLPPGAKEDTATATYRDGILEIRVELDTTAERGHRIPVKMA